jgi:outer membrane protein OmpA-like peptidoglycan-associated protein
MTMAHDAVRTAVKAEKLARERAFQAALDAEREAHAQETAQLEQSIEAAQSEAERARLLAQQRQMTIEMEKNARSQVEDQLAQTRAEAEQEAERRQQAEEEAWRARLEAERAQRMAERLSIEKVEAQREAAAAQQERERARARLEMALGKVAETRETARGLIVSLPDILFDFDKASLRPEAKQVLSKVCGILLVADGYELSVEGHTDSVGSDSYNLDLSRNRAESVQSFLANCGLTAEQISAAGFGESQPVASNNTPDGRQQNRRVEIVVEDNEQFEVGLGRSGAETEISHTSPPARRR